MINVDQILSPALNIEDEHEFTYIIFFIDCV